VNSTNEYYKRELYHSRTMWVYLYRVIYTCIRHCLDTLNIPLTYSLIDIETLCLELNQVLSLVIFQTCIKNGY